jgi:hypothetical protein
MLVALLFDPGILTASPDETAARFSGIGTLERVSVAPGYLTLEAKRNVHSCAIDYVKGPDGWQFSSLQIALYPATVGELKTLYNATDGVLHDKLGKTVWSRRMEGSALKSKAYRVGKTLELGIAENSDKSHGSFVGLSLGEPQGEAE